jgi:hypothetical protein
MIPIGERALAWIQKYRDAVRPQMALAQDDGTLFLTNQGEAFTPNRLTQMVRDTINAAGIHKKGSCHLFRHTMATLMLENGADRESGRPMSFAAGASSCHPAQPQFRSANFSRLATLPVVCLSGSLNRTLMLRQNWIAASEKIAGRSGPPSGGASQVISLSSQISKEPRSFSEAL